MSDLEGQNADLPNFLAIHKFAASRIREIQVMNKALSTTTAVKLAFQKLPRHMRRRAMSHNVKRLPRRLREIHLNQQLKSGLPPKQKRPSRKYRRRPYTLTSEFIRRQRRVTWLNTHIWHAKRFHMIEKWGYRIPHSPCDRAFRACYRATSKHCLVQDISYCNCLEIVGEFDHIVDCFKKMTDSNTGLSVAAKSFIGGLREGNTILFRPDNRKAIGKVEFLWKPNCDNTKERTLWLWCHAAYYNELLDVFTTNLNFKPCINDQSVIIVDQSVLIDDEGLPNDNGSVQKYFNHQLTLKVLKWDLSRFRLTGPLSNAILQYTFKLAENTTVAPEWVQNYLNNSTSQPFTSSHDYWEQLKCISSPTEVSPHIVLPLIITDPRYNFPKKRTKALPLETLNNSNIPSRVNFFECPLWDENIRKLVQESKISNAKLAELRQQLLVPGSDLDEPPTKIPILLVQRPGRKQKEYRGYGSGWDIILPSSWAQPIWLSLIIWGGRSGGLRENDRMIFESGSQHFLCPDSLAGEQEENEVSLKMKEQFFRLPPNKRTNFARFKITSPFEWNWRLLLKEWSHSGSLESDFFVLRDKKLLKSLQDKFCKHSKDTQSLELSENCLIPIKITLLKRGCCKQFSIICLPQDGDLSVEPVESNCNDPNEKARKNMRKEHKVLLKRLKRRRKIGKNKGDLIPIDKDILKNYTSKMRNLWLPESTKIRNSCSREVMGFVKHGDFSFLAAKSTAVGYITSNSLMKLLDTNRNKVLVRNTHSKQYRLGTLEIIGE